MGFFYADTINPPKTRATRTPSARSAAPRPKKGVLTGERGCLACPLKARWPQLVSPEMPASGNNEDADILVLGEGPGEEEDNLGQVFVGPTGKLLRQHLSAKFTDRLAFQNAVRCRPDDNRTPTAQEMHACSIHLDDDIARLPLKAILGVGGD